MHSPVRARWPSDEEASKKGDKKPPSLGSNLSDVPLAVHHLLVRRHVVAHQRLRRQDSSWVSSTLGANPLIFLLLPQSMLEGICM